MDIIVIISVVAFVACISLLTSRFRDALDGLHPGWRDSLNYVSFTFILILSIGFFYAASVFLFDPLAYDKVSMAALAPINAQIQACVKAGGAVSIPVKCVMPNETSLVPLPGRTPDLGVQGFQPTAGEHPRTPLP